MELEIVARGDNYLIGHVGPVVLADWRGNADAKAYAACLGLMERLRRIHPKTAMLTSQNPSMSLVFANERRQMLEALRQAEQWVDLFVAIPRGSALFRLLVVSFLSLTAGRWLGRRYFIARDCKEASRFLNARLELYVKGQVLEQAAEEFFQILARTPPA